MSNRLVRDVVNTTEMVYDRTDVVKLAGLHHNFMSFMEVTLNVSMNTKADPATRDWARCLQLMTVRRRLFSNEGGRICLGDAQVGVNLVVIFYHPTPFFLRPATSSDRRLFIGETYVHGLMYGEALKQFDDGFIHEKKWTI